MTYVRKIIAKDEQLIGIARLHWIYVIKGLVWFITLAALGWGIDFIFTRGMMILGSATDTYALPSALMSLSNWAMIFLMGGGFFIFLLYVMKVLVTEVGLSTRRIIFKEGLFFVKVKQVDLEEIRGENLDMGYLGRMLGYAYVMLDCRFIGDVRLPAIENPERFIKALHGARSKTQDALSVVMGKGNPIPVAMSAAMADEPDNQTAMAPQPPQPAPTPEVQPGQQPEPEVAPSSPGREMPARPTPHSPQPASPSPQPQPEMPPAQPSQPVPAPFNPEPPLQPPTGDVPMTMEQMQAAAQNAQMQTPQAIPPQTLPQQQPVQTPPVPQQQATIDPNVMAQAIQQVMPMMAEEVVKKMAEQGLIHPEKTSSDGHDKDVDTDLINSFDDARLKDEHGNDLPHKMEHAIH